MNRVESETVLLRRVQYGYRPMEVQMSLPAPPKADVRWLVPKPEISGRLGPELVSLGCHIEGAAMPHPCLRDPWSAVLGTVKRSASRHPTPDAPTLVKFKNFVTQWLDENLTPLEADSDTSFENWLKNTNYPQWKKIELLDLYSSMDNACEDRNLLVNKCFIKQETYPEYKFPRGIYSRSDTAKCHIGPMVKLIEEEVYKNPHFIKHVPVAERPAYIMSLVHNPTCTDYLATDFTAFESQFTKELMHTTEIQMLKYMTHRLPDREKFWWILDNVMTGVNDCRFREFRMYVEATRMSGEMTTSLSNGFSNLMFFLFTARECGLKNVQGVVEGDDGLFSYDLPSNARIPDSSDFAKLGLTIKIEKHTKISNASFCGMVFDETEKIPLTDPLKALANLGWMDRRFLKAKNSKLRSLLRCKALSMKSQYPGCPILDAASSWVLRCTAGCQTERLFKSGVFGTYRSEKMAANLKGYARFDRLPNVGLSTRILMSEKYQVPVGVQLGLEQWFDAQNSLVPIPTHLFGDTLPTAWRENFDQFVSYLGCEPLPDKTPLIRLQPAIDLIRTQTLTKPKKTPSVPPDKVHLFQHTPVSTRFRESLVSLTRP